MPLRESEAFASMMTNFSNPLVGILAGMVFTAIIQSSSSGLIRLPTAVYVLFGHNIGTCITAVLASIGTNRNAKRTTIIHLMFNVIGTVLFTIICMTTPLTSVIESITPGRVAAQIANMHTLFNIVTTLLLLPFGNYLALLATKILPEKQEEQSDVMHLEYIRPMEKKRESQIGSSAIVTNEIRGELSRMLLMAKENVNASFEAVREGNAGMLPQVEEREEYIDYLNKEISKYISKVLVNETNPKDSQYISALFKVCGNLERIGDHAVNICEYTQMMREKNISFSEAVSGEITEMQKVSNQALEMLQKLQGTEEPAESMLKKIEDLEQRFDDMTEEYRKAQIGRMQTGKCSDEACILYSEMLTDFERIGDHILNISQEMGQGQVSE